MESQNLSFDTHYFRLLASQDGPEEGGMRVQIPATETLHYTFDSENSCMSNGGDTETCSEEGSTGFPHPPSQPASSTKVGGISSVKFECTLVKPTKDRSSCLNRLKAQRLYKSMYIH